MRLGLVERAAAILRSGGPVIIADDQDREAEGDIVAAATGIGADTVNLMITRGKGLLCCAVGGVIAARLGLVAGEGALHDTAFAQSLDLKEGCTTGISCADRAACLSRIADPVARAEDFARPGHVFPLIARSGGVIERRGHTEASVDLCAIAGLAPAAAICEVLRPDGTMASRADLEALAEELGTVLLDVEDISRWRKRSEFLLSPQASATLPTVNGTFVLTSFSSAAGGGDGKGPLLLSMGIDPPVLEKGMPFPTADPALDGLLVRVHSECATGEVFGSLRCDCGPQLAEAMRRIGREGRGAIVYLRQEGRGIGLDAKLKAYQLQDGGMDTVDANVALGFHADSRDYWEAAQILRAVGCRSIRLLTNNPRKADSLRAGGIDVRRIGIVVGVDACNRGYLETKRSRMGHLLEMEE